MSKRWIEPVDAPVPQELQAEIGGHPLVARTLAQRGITQANTARAFLDPSYYRPTSPAELPNLPAAADRLSYAIQRRQRICVWGDFDVDGQTATTLLVSTLRDLDADVIYHIPHRERESHGISLPVLKEIIAGGIDLLLTCDTGVAAHRAIDYARQQHVDVIVTDHHELPPELPPALAVVNPKLLPESHPLRELPGVGVAFKLAEALYRGAGRPDGAAQHLDLAALGIVADVATLAGDVRYLLQLGLKALQQTSRLGLLNLMELAELNPALLNEEHIGFQLAPRLNALGRLSDANEAVEFLTTGDPVRAKTLALMLDGLNARRKLLVNQVIQAALAQIERDPSLLDRAALVLSHPEWPGGVIGIVAGRLAEQFNRPTLLITTPEGELGRGSARSVEGCNITEAIAANGELLVSFGGHPMAAGLAIEPEKIPALSRALSRSVRDQIGEITEPSLPIDSYLHLSDLSLELTAEIERLAPFGPGNPPLVLATRSLTVASERTLGRGEDHRLLVVEDQNGNNQQVFWWQSTGLPLPQGPFDLAYTVRASDFRGVREVQVMWLDARPLEVPVVEVRPRRSARKAIDYRNDPGAKTWEQWAGQDNVQIWLEAAPGGGDNVRDRNQLEPAATLVAATIPPGPDEWQAVLEKVSPQAIILLGVDPGMDDPNAFTRRLAGLVKHALKAKDGRIGVSQLAAALAQREAVARAGLAWLQSGEQITILESQGDELVLAPGSRIESPDITAATGRLKALLQETAAYRAYWMRAEAERLVG